MTPEDRISYIRAVWRSFQKLAQTTRCMSNAEYHFARKWAVEEIPFATVQQAMDNFRGRPASLQAVDGAVREAEAYRRKALA